MMKRHNQSLSGLSILLVSLLMLFASCKENDTISHRYPCRFHFYKELHPTSLIFSAYNSPGTYVFVYSKVEIDGTRSSRFVYVESSSNKVPVERNRMETQIENNVPYVLGANNEIGLIIGCTNFSGPVAYDRICPNCTGIYPLVWAGNGQRVSCNSCKRVYELETGAISSGSDGEPLMRYVISLDNVRLNVTN